MSHVKSNIDAIFTKSVRDFSIDELESMTVEQFDALPLADQISVYNNHPEQYARLTGRTEDTHTEDTRSDAQRFADSFEARIDAIISRAFHAENQ